MATLQLAVKGEYFDAIKRGEKIEEYRLVNAYWGRRIFGRWYDRLIITRGYPHKEDASKRIDIPYCGYEIKVITHKHFGGEPVKVFAIKINLTVEG
ncbi:ASCH domain-containing protein [Enterobacter sp. E76]|nr:ASCH domain-containing protein [Enterobacter sp. E76]